jgi:lipoprotein-anchoring transpeptidase ErfK/SrfK
VNSLKPLILLAILGGVGFGVYRSLNKVPGEPPPGTDTSVTSAPQIQLGDPKSTAASEAAPKPSGPNMLQPEPSSTAPPFNVGTIASARAPASVPPGNAAVLPATASPSASQSPPAESIAPVSVQPGETVEVPSSAAAVAAPTDHPVRTSSFAAAWSTIQPKLAAGQLAEALKDLTAWYDHSSLTPSEQEMVMRLLNQLAGTVIYSREHLLAPPHRVQAGETLADIAAQNHVTPQLLAKINELDPEAPSLKIGDEIKVIPGPFSAIVDVGNDRLTLMLDGCYAGSFSLADLGKMVGTRIESGTPAEFTVVQKTTAPIYNSARGEIKAGDPANPLGDYLLALSGELAIHGTNPRASAQTEQPSGGIRVTAADIADVYDILTVGSRVIVRK